MRKLALGLLGAVALTAASSANAAVVIVGGGTTVDVTGPTTVDGGINFSLGYSDSGSSSPFTETLQWNNTLSGIYGITLSTTAAIAGWSTTPIISTCPSSHCRRSRPACVR